ncbi:hypothetical protein VDG1235_4828 [Verrucomicrobiia bacterium DG1235]|nr:hypothetical protein VDG1235_4828 [Verrucomicrobiae bacterium DG1235]
MDTDQISKLPEGWYTATDEEAERLHRELQKELHSEHLLKGVPVEVVAHRDGATDDILCQHKEKEERFTVIHLSWSMKEEVSKDFPMIEVDGSFDDFLAYEERFCR